MVFIITDNDNGNLFDINDSRKSRDLENILEDTLGKNVPKLNIFLLIFILVIIF